MNNNTKTRSLITIIIFLLITNIAMVFFIMLGKPDEKKQRPSRDAGMYNELQNEVGFSKDQLARFQTLRNEEMTKIKPLFGQVRTAKKNLYDNLYDDKTPDSLVMADADSIAYRQKTLDMQMYQYFKKIRSLCTPDQLQKFDSSLQKVVTRMVGRSGRDNSQRKK